MVNDGRLQAVHSVKANSTGTAATSLVRFVVRFVVTAAIAASAPNASAQRCVGDFDNDGLVGATDLTAVLSGWGQCSPLESAVAGSSRAGAMLGAAIGRSDSVDLVVIGDSNAGFPGDHGYQVGLERALALLGGMDAYATPLVAGGMSGGPGSLSNGLVLTGTTIVWSDDLEYGNFTAVGPVRTLVEAAASADIDAAALVARLGIDTSLLPKSTGREWLGAFVPAGTQYTSNADRSYIRLETNSPIVLGSGYGSTPAQYRVVYGTFASEEGQFRPIIHTVDGVTYAPKPISTHAGIEEPSYATATVDFTTRPAVPTAVAHTCGWDGLSMGPVVTGPFACLWHSVIRRDAKGFAVNNLIYDSGRSTTQLADRVEGMGSLLDSYLKELRERQVAAGGSGRVIVWMNSGINGGETPDSWTRAIERLCLRIGARWAATGGAPENLAFVFSVTHPTTHIIGWTATRPEIAIAASLWAQSEGRALGACVVDLAVAYPAEKLAAGVAGSGTLYDAAGQTHLRSGTPGQPSGYDAVAAAAITALLGGAQ